MVFSFGNAKFRVIHFQIKERAMKKKDGVKLNQDIVFLKKLR